MENRISDYCNNCKKYFSTDADACKGKTCSCNDYEPILINSKRKNFRT